MEGFEDDPIDLKRLDAEDSAWNQGSDRPVDTTPPWKARELERLTIERRTDVRFSVAPAGFWRRPL